MPRHERASDPVKMTGGAPRISRGGDMAVLHGTEHSMGLSISFGWCLQGVNVGQYAKLGGTGEELNDMN